MNDLTVSGTTEWSPHPNLIKETKAQSCSELATVELGLYHVCGAQL